MPRRHRAVQPPYRRNVPVTTSLLDVADQAYKAGVLDWLDVQKIQDQLFALCPEHHKPMKGVGVCEDCIEKIAAIGRAMRGVKS